MNHDHPLAKAELTLEEFAEADHLLVSLSGDTTGYTDQVLLQHGLSRRIAVTVNHFSSVANLIKHSDLICVTPIAAVSKQIIAGEISATKPPLELMPQQVSSIWHKRQDSDQGLIWLREHLKRIINRKVKIETQQVMDSLCKNNSSMCESHEE
ncbi:LysR substrate-binding domain-containing protein [Paraglaciecola aquimarina]|uniref:LysR substrate-binding domain-containing protein n=1 Tax=Paraglaciecola aquimarina TaxID=1235557 RepID=A0ABU3SVD0_9ALTE|nr:LysR substrate-binding domain-containing protein [Paraglaciecola aquimarina]MDU0353980.1 LysR substrate-binding domain-containing protein [Paraglaciecola aquimarina]